MGYVAVLLNYAECAFETGDASERWKYVNIIRDRAWGNLEVNLEQGDYPIAFNSKEVSVPDAEQFYETYKSQKGYSADTWKVALTILIKIQDTNQIQKYKNK